MSSYQGRFTWRNRLGKYCIAHDDGAVSLLVSWDGFDVSMLTQKDKESCWNDLRQFINHVPDEYVIESHGYRSSNAEVGSEYLKQNEKIVRSHELGTLFRQEMADHLGQFSRTNKTYFVITAKPPKRSLFRGIKKKLIKQSVTAQQLEELAGELVQYLPGAQISPNQDYLNLIEVSLNPASRYWNRSFIDEPRFFLNEQLVQAKPEWKDGFLQLPDGGHLKVLLMVNYPDAAAAWFETYANNFRCDIHVSQVIQPMNTRSAMRKSERESRANEGTASDTGIEYAAGKASDLSGFRSFVADNDLEVFGNTYLITLHHNDRSTLKLASQELRQSLISQNITFREGEKLELLYYRISQPGQGYKTLFSRVDHEFEVANMSPCITYRKGADNPTILRLDANAQLVGFDYPDGGVNHSFTAAKTGSGKGVNKVAEICETYPLGIDWYIAEIGTSYQWTVEAFGGNYVAIDPDKTVVNPFPPYAYADPESDLPLNVKMVEPTVKAISFLLTGKLEDMTPHEQAAAESAMQLMYIDDTESNKAPGFPEYLVMLKDFSEEAELKEQRLAAHRMAANLQSFLSTTAGATFSKPDNFVLSEGITGVDLKPLATSGNDKLMIFYLVFIALRFSQFAFMNSSPSRILLDELHEFTRTEEGKIIIGRLAKQITRMGRKDAGFFDAVSQEPDDIDVDDGVMGQMQHRNLLYMQEGHDKTIERLRLPKKAADLWKSYPNPESLNYRQGIRTSGDEVYDLHLTFSQLMLDLADSSPRSLTLKEVIGKKTVDPLERLRLFREAKEMRKSA